MNNAVKKLFTCCSSNRVVAADTNFKDFCDQFKNLEPNSKSCRWFDNKFKENKEFEYSVNGNDYYFQRLV